MKKSIKLDQYNKNILSILHKEADLSNIELAERVNLSPSACFQRVKSMKESGYFGNYIIDLKLEQVCEHVLAFIEFTLYENNVVAKKNFIATIENIPEIMDCMEVSGDVDFISLSCFPNIQELNDTCNKINEDLPNFIKSIKISVVLNRAKWDAGYPLEKLKWIDAKD